ncbi:hypothetical protein FCM30_06825 [Lelliottia aquatilis]|uniref:hypothetical protein n=1 Tax=Lelliottia aquatilis TaxID=2080838 RepID=UPI0015757E68|nr:hypothetical protein [Lelliottia aquatilis]NTZ45475.1 hypothetical protein [Lelliottia aquatilis]
MKTMSVIEVMNKKSRIGRYLLGLMMVLPLSVGHSAPLEVTAEIVPGSCDALLKTSDAPGKAASNMAEVSINAVDRIGMLNGGVSFGDNYVEVSLKCDPVGTNSTIGVPSIMIDGTPLGTNPYIFSRVSGNMDSRVGVVMSTVKPSLYNTTAWNAGDYVKPKGEDRLTNKAGADGNTVKQLYYVGLSCGSSAAECQSPQPLTTGVIKVVMSFTFAYN